VTISPKSASGYSAYLGGNISSTGRRDSVAQKGSTGEKS
jgi:hypothetical protein